jgi:MFS family permease
MKRVWTVGTLTYSAGGLIVLFCWLLGGDFAWSMKERAGPPILQIALRQYGASDTTVGWLVGSLPAAMMILLGPAISYRSDRHRGPQGRRIPYLRALAPFVVLGFAGLALSPRIGIALDARLGSHPGSLNRITLVLLGSCWTLFEFASVITNTLFVGLVKDVVPTQLLGRFYGAFRALSLLAGIVFGFYLLGAAETHFLALGLAIAALFGAGFGVMCLKVREGAYPAPAEPAGGRSRPIPGAVGDYCRECFGRPYYLWFYSAVALAAMAFVPVNLFSLFFAQRVELPLSAYGKCIALTYVISLAAAYPIGWLSDRFHPLTVGRWAIATYAVVALLGGWFATTASRFSVALVAHGVASGVWMTAAAAMFPRLLPHRNFAQFYSAAWIAISVGTLIAAPAVGFILDRSGHTYRYTFIASGILAVIAMTALQRLYRRFLALGGPAHYVAPE